MNDFATQPAAMPVSVGQQQQQTPAQGVTPVFVGVPIQQAPAQQSGRVSFDDAQQNVFDGEIGKKVAKWKEAEASYLTQISALTAQLEQEKQKSQSYSIQLEGYVERETAAKYNIPAQFVDFAIFNAKKLVSESKPFAKAMEEYVAANGALFGVAQQATQPQQPAAPAGQQAMPGAVPAQGMPQQQVAQSTQPVVQPTQMMPMQAQPGVVQQQAQLAPSTAPGGAVQYGAASLSFAGSPVVAGGAGPDQATVDNFLKSRGLKT